MDRLSDLLVGVLRQMEAAYRRERWPLGLATGLADLDLLTGGLQRSDLIVLGGRPSAGKTALALTLSENVTLRQDVGVAFVSPEMSKEQIAMRVLCSQARVPLRRFRTGTLAEREFPRLAMAAGRLADAPLHVMDAPALSVAALRRQLLALGREIGLVVVDRLDLLIGGEPCPEDSPGIAATGRALKALARELNVPLLVTTPFDVRVEDRAVPIPPVQDLPGDGELEHLADVVMLLYRQEVYEPHTSRRGRADLIVAKQRNGPEGWLQLAFLADYARFENAAPEVDVA